MKVPLILVILAAFAGLAVYSAQDEINMFDMACLPEANVTETEFRKFLTNGMKASEANPNIKCMIKCVMEKRGVLKNGDFDTEKAFKDIMMAGDWKGHEVEIKESVKSCKTEKGCHDCDTAFKISMCLLEFKSRTS